MAGRILTGVTFTANRKMTLGAGLGAPVQTAPATSTTGGTGLAAATQYFYVVTGLNANGETTRSNEQSVTTGAGTTNSNTVNWNALAGATGYNVYRGTVAGAEGVFYTVAAVTTFLDTGAAPTGTATPPVADSTNTYAVGSTIPNATVKALKKLSALLGRREIVPSQEIKQIRKSAGRLKKPKPYTAYNPKEKASL